jgi:hypothetical protein
VGVLKIPCPAIYTVFLRQGRRKFFLRIVSPIFAEAAPQAHLILSQYLRQYLKQESIDKKRKEFDANGWQLFSKKSQVHFILVRWKS